jgi:hypothetical protein
MAEELFALRGALGVDVWGSLFDHTTFYGFAEISKMSRSRYLRRHRSERYLKGTHSAGLTANFPKTSTVGLHEFCRRSYSRRAALWELMLQIDCKFIDQIKEFTYTVLNSSQPDIPYSIHRKPTYQKSISRTHANAAETALLHFRHVVFRPHDFIAQLERRLHPLHHLPFCHGILTSCKFKSRLLEAANIYKTKPIQQRQHNRLVGQGSGPPYQAKSLNPLD